MLKITIVYNVMKTYTKKKRFILLTGLQVISFQYQVQLLHTYQEVARKIKTKRNVGILIVIVGFFIFHIKN